MKVEKLPLALAESADVDDALCLDAHSLERRLVGDRGDDEGARVLEADEDVLLGKVLPVQAPSAGLTSLGTGRRIPARRIVLWPPRQQFQFLTKSQSSKL